MKSKKNYGIWPQSGHHETVNAHSMLFTCSDFLIFAVGSAPNVHIDCTDINSLADDEV